MTAIPASTISKKFIIPRTLKKQKIIVIFADGTPFWLWDLIYNSDTGLYQPVGKLVKWKASGKVMLGHPQLFNDLCFPLGPMGRGSAMMFWLQDFHSGLVPKAFESLEIQETMRSSSESHTDQLGRLRDATKIRELTVAGDEADAMHSERFKRLFKMVGSGAAAGKFPTLRGLQPPSEDEEEG